LNVLVLFKLFFSPGYFSVSAGEGCSGEVATMNNYGILL